MPLVLDGTNGVSGVDGTASNPAIEGTDSNTGIFYPAADTVAIGTGGTERLRVDSAGNVGEGVTPAAWASGIKALQVGANSYASTVDLNNGVTVWGSNYYNDGGNKFANASSRYALQILQDTTSGAQSWRVSNAAGTAGNAVTFTTAMTLTADGSLLVGTTAQTWNQSGRGVIELNGSSDALIGFKTGGTSAGFVYHDGSSLRLNNIKNGAMTFSTNDTERARITSGGDFNVGNVNQAFSTTGASLAGNGTIYVTRDAAIPMWVNRLTNDGTLVEFAQATTVEGTISVSGTTVSYNGGHLARYSQLPSGQRDESIVKGTVLSNLDEMCEWLDAEGNPLPNEQLNRTKVSDVEGDTNVAGVFVNWDNDDQDNPYDMNIAMTGDMIIRIAQGITVQKGDLLMSAGDGTAKPQGDDIVRSKTVAKVTSNHVTCTYDDGSYCVPCVLMAC